LARKTERRESTIHKAGVVFARCDDDKRDRSQVLWGQFCNARGGMLPVKHSNKVVVGDAHAIESLASVREACECDVGSSCIELVQYIWKPSGQISKTTPLAASPIMRESVGTTARAA